MSPFLSDILFTLAIGMLIAPVAGFFVFDRQPEVAKQLRIKQSVLMGALVFFVPTIVYLMSYVFFSVLNR